MFQALSLSHGCWPCWFCLKSTDSHAKLLQTHCTPFRGENRDLYLINDKKVFYIKRTWNDYNFLSIFNRQLCVTVPMAMYSCVGQQCSVSLSAVCLSRHMAAVLRLYSADAVLDRSSHTQPAVCSTGGQRESRPLTDMSDSLL